MNRTANSSFGRRRNGRNWRLKKSSKFGPLRGLLHRVWQRYPMPEPLRMRTRRTGVSMSDVE